MARRDGPTEPRVREYFQKQYKESPTQEPSILAQAFKTIFFAVPVAIGTLVRWATQEKEEPGVHADWRDRK